MPSASDSVIVPADAAAVAGRYLRVERPASGAIVATGAVVAVLPLLFAPYVLAILWAVLVLAALRVPVFRTSGTARLVTETTPTAVSADFEGATPLFLAFLWGIADTVEQISNGARYEVSYLFGLRSVRMETTVRSRSVPDDGVDCLELTVTANGKPWGTYDVTIRDRDGETVVDAAWSADRRFGLRRLPQQLIVRRYRQSALRAQGYGVVSYTASLSL